MNPYLNSINGFGGGFIAFWPISGAAPAPPKQGQEIYFLRSVGKLMNN